MCAEPLAGSPQGSPSSPAQQGDARDVEAHPQGRYHEEYVRVPADKDAELVLLRGVIDEGARRGWKLISAIKQPGDDVLVVTWDTSGSSG
ncbi:MAG: hypothetical protein M3R38_11150 [Actinomycetota bacterium]|nr:hypothetical protein [Actinomycetota bacterium]